MNSKSLTAIDLRLTRPPESLKPIPPSPERPRTSFDDRNQPLHSITSSTAGAPAASSPRKKQKNKKGPQNKQLNDNAAMFEDLSPEAQRRLNAMLRNFCLEESGALKTDIDLEQYAIDAGEVITNATIQELCLIQPNLLTLNLNGCQLISDVALWTIARHCPNIHHLILSDCHKITNIGLRSLSMRCSELITLDFTNCHLLDDLGLTTIACGCWKLEHLILINCINITDTGVGKVVKACGRLETLNLLNCHRVGEFGDHALKEIGAFCHQLKYLNLIGCRHVQNDGLIALSHGCQLLEQLYLSHCDGINGSGLMALCKHLSHLKILILRDCENLLDQDMKLFQYSSFLKNLTLLDLSDCKNISNQGISTLCDSIGPTIKSLHLSGCKITDTAITSISLSCSKLNELDLSRCRLLTDQSVHTLVSHVTGLTTLKLDGNQKITSKTLLAYTGAGVASSSFSSRSGVATSARPGSTSGQLSRTSTRGVVPDIIKLEFANISQQWFGYEPKKDANKLIVAKELLRIQTGHVIKIQCLIRQHQAYQRYLERWRQWIVNKTIPRVQALFRGRVERQRYERYKVALRRQQMSIRIQRTWRRYLVIMRSYLLQRKERILLMKIKSAQLIQKIYWGMIGKRRAQERRNEIANERLERAREQAIKEMKSIQIQTIWYIYCAKKKMKLMKERLSQQKLLEAQQEMASRVIQRLERGRIGRKKAAYARWLSAKKVLMWHKSLILQRVYRGHVGRLIAKAAREERWRRICWQKAITLQCFWRTMRAKMIVSILKALQLLRTKQAYNATEIQRVYRGYRVRLRMEEMRSKLLEQLKRVLAVIVIQRIFRGHKGREIAEVERALKESEMKAKPLYSLLRDLEEEGIKLTRDCSKLEGVLEHTEKEIHELTRELDHAVKTTSKFTDSSRVNGIPQRFLTKYLIVRLNDNLNNERVGLSSSPPSPPFLPIFSSLLSPPLMPDSLLFLPLFSSSLLVCPQELLKKHLATHIEMKSNLRAIDRKIRAAKRELVPLTTGLIVKTKNERFQRLRNHVRLVRKSATKIQALWRRAIVRQVYRDPHRDYWIQCFDEEQGPEPYYYNTWTLETVWKPPLAYKLFVSRYRGGAGSAESSVVGGSQQGGGGEYGDWIEIEEGGQTYHYNVQTKEYVLKE
jgi:hypothetical protein